MSSITGKSLEVIEDSSGPKIRIESIDGVVSVPHYPSQVMPKKEPRFGATGLSEYERLQTESILQSTDVEITKGLGFVLLPHTKEFEDIFEQAIRPAMEKNELHALKANDIYSTGAILSQV